eukprot:715912-Prorocentrum_minimum.AAC.2
MLACAQGLVLRALRDTLLPRLTPSDQPLLSGLLGDLFPEVAVSLPAPSAFEAKLNEVCAEAKLKVTAGFAARVAALAEVLTTRHSVLLLGGAGMGKTETWRVLAKLCPHLSFAHSGTALVFGAHTPLQGTVRSHYKSDTRTRLWSCRAYGWAGIGGGPSYTPS